MKKLFYFVAATFLMVTILAVPALAADIGWEPVVGGGAATGNGFGVPSNQNIYSLAEYGGELYAASHNASGLQIWRSADGTTWIPAVGPGATMPAGFGFATHSIAGPMVAFNGMLIVAVGDATTGCQLWSTTDGINWTMEVGGVGLNIADDGFGDVNNMYVSSMTVFAGNLYVATVNSTGTKLYSSSDGHSWGQVGTSGFGHGNNTQTYSLQVFGPSLFASTYDYLTTGGSIFSSPDGATWTSSVGYAPSLIGPGFDDPAVWGLRLCVYNGVLCAASRNNGGVTAMWNTTDGVNWTSMPGYTTAVAAAAAGSGGETYAMFADGDYMLTGAGFAAGSFVFASDDGSAWYPISAAGFGSSNTQVRSFVRFGDYIYAGTNNDTDGSEVWRISIDSLDTFFAVQTTTPDTELPYTGR